MVTMTPEQQFQLAMVALILTGIFTPTATIATTILIRVLDRRDRLEVAAAARTAAQEAKDAAGLARAVAEKMAREQTLTDVHSDLREAVLEGTASSKKAEVEANHANLKIQALQDDLQKALGLPKVAVTEDSIKAEKGEAK